MKNNFKGMMDMTIPPALQPGDTVALVAPCSPVNPEQLPPAVALLEKWGYTPALYPSCFARRGYLAGDDASRADDVNRAFADPAVKAILAIRGGYGGARLAKYLNYDIIKANPKIFCGFSDVTVLHALLNQRCGLATFHTPMLGAPAMREDSFSREGLADILRGQFPRVLCNATEPMECLCAGCAEGILTGGNLTVIASTVGTPYELETRGRILFLEDVGERAYAIDRALVHLRDGGLLAKCSGILLGTWQDCEPPRDFSLRELFLEHLSPLKIPVIGNLQCGHSVPSLSLPLGMKVKITTRPLKINVTF